MFAHRVRARGGTAVALWWHRGPHPTPRPSARVSRALRVIHERYRRALIGAGLRKRPRRGSETRWEREGKVLSGIPQTRRAVGWHSAPELSPTAAPPPPHGRRDPRVPSRRAAPPPSPPPLSHGRSSVPRPRRAAALERAQPNLLLESEVPRWNAASRGTGTRTAIGGGEGERGGAQRDAAPSLHTHFALVFFQRRPNLLLFFAAIAAFDLRGPR